MLIKEKITDLLSKPLWQLTGEEYVHLHAYACSKCKDDSRTESVTKVMGVRKLAEYLVCCESKIYALKREGVLDSAIISRIGKNTVFDGEKARELAQAYIQESRRGKAMK